MKIDDFREEIAFPYINDTISEILGEFDIMIGDVSPELDKEYREAYDKLSSCIYKQIQKEELERWKEKINEKWADEECAREE
tara:strand:+ start:249 stop:494 length:246 start_codon:yes stop_codon:yes gene_type:complete